MKLPIFFALLATACVAQANCPTSLPLQGTATINSCAPSAPKCVSAGQALFQYLESNKDANPDVLFIRVTGSPWHLYGPDFHILEIDELAQLVKRQANKVKRVVLAASWSGVAPDARTPSLAQQLSTALGGMPVSGQDGFVWVSKNGAVRTTRQAISVTAGGPYWVPQGEEIMVSRVSGWPIDFEEQFTKAADGKGLMLAGVGRDTYSLCPERALQLFDAAAALGEPVAAYNAAIMRLQRGAPGDAAAARALLAQSAGAGEKKAQAKLDALAKGAPAAPR